MLRSRAEISFEAVGYCDLAQNLETLQFLIGHLSFMLYLHPASLIEPGNEASSEGECLKKPCVWINKSHIIKLAKVALKPQQGAV